MTNETLMQYFEWYLPNDGKHWQRLAADAPELAQKGISKIWLPPAFKATHAGDVGYVFMTFSTSENLTKKERFEPNMELKPIISLPLLA